MKLFDNCNMTEGMYKFNQKHHKYICCIWYDNAGYVHISGDNHERKYLYYPWREAVKMYNTEAREKAIKLEKHLKQCRENFYKECKEKINMDAIHAGLNDILMKAGI